MIFHEASAKKNWKKSLWLFNAQCPDCDTTFSSENDFLLDFSWSFSRKKYKKDKTKKCCITVWALKCPKDFFQFFAEASKKGQKGQISVKFPCPAYYPRELVQDTVIFVTWRPLKKAMHLVSYLHTFQSFSVVHFSNLLSECHRSGLTDGTRCIGGVVTKSLSRQFNGILTK